MARCLNGIYRLASHKMARSEVSCIWFIHSRKFTETLITAISAGIVLPRFLTRLFATNGCLLPPLAEQRRIVARIDELFTEIADGETALTRARDDLDTWRRALLKAAVTGELTREWREHNKPNETGENCCSAIKLLGENNRIRGVAESWRASSSGKLPHSIDLGLDDARSPDFCAPSNGYSRRLREMDKALMAWLTAPTSGRPNLSNDAVKIFPKPSIRTHEAVSQTRRSTILDGATAAISLALPRSRRAIAHVCASEHVFRVRTS